MAFSLNNTDYSVSASAAAALLAPANASLVITKATVCNTDTAAHTLTLYRVPNGGTAGATNELISALSIAAGKTVTLPLSGHTLVQQQSLQAVADATTVLVLSLSYTQQ